MNSKLWPDENYTYNIISFYYYTAFISLTKCQIDINVMPNKSPIGKAKGAAVILNGKEREKRERKREKVGK